MRSWGRGPHGGIRALRGRDMRAVAPSLLREDTRRQASTSQRRMRSLENKLCQAWSWTVQLFQNFEKMNLCCLTTTPQPMLFCYSSLNRLGIRSGAFTSYLYNILNSLYLGLPGGSVVKNSPANAGDANMIPGSGRFPGEGNGNTFQYSCLGNPRDREGWQASPRGLKRVQHDLVTKKQQQTPYLITLDC